MSVLASSRPFARCPSTYPTRTEESILREHSADIVAAVGQGAALSEFGSGSSAKTRVLIEALLARQESLVYVPIDISAEILKECALALLRQYQRLWLTAISAEYDAAIAHLPRHRGPRLILFLGSNIGNMEDREASAFLARVAAEMQARDRLLVGFDRLKDPRVIESAYNDSAGVTAAFNKNRWRASTASSWGSSISPSSTTPRRSWWRRDGSRCVWSAAALSGCEWARSTRCSASRAASPFTRRTATSTDLASLEHVCRAAGLSVAELWTDRREWFALALLRRGRP